MTLDGATARVPAFNGFNVQSMVAFGDTLVVAGIRCEGEPSDSRCDGTPEIRAIERTRRQAWTVVLPRPPGGVGSAYSLVVLGSTEDVAWVEVESGLVAIGPSGDIVERLSQPNGDACLIDGAPYVLASRSQAAGDAPSTSAGVPPTATATPGAAASQHLVVQRADGTSWRTVDGSGTVVEGPVPLGQCANGGFETSGAVDGVPTQRWTPQSGRWIELAIPADLDPLLGPPTLTTEGVQYLVVPDTGEVVRRVADEVAYEPVGLTLENGGLGEPGSRLRVGEDGDVVFACVSPESVMSCGFGRRTP